MVNPALNLDEKGDAPASTYVNYVPMRGGRVVAICQHCGRRSCSSKPDEHGEPDLWDVGRGWSQAPYPHDFQHADGSVGSTFTCPLCNKRLRAGEALKIRNYHAGAALRAVILRTLVCVGAR